ncbi:MAG TPA: MFS transporter [Microbacterium sp.]|nr:MFS transporter [Microbacterium sp.]
MIEVLRDPTYRTLFSAQVIALAGTGLLTVALGLLAFDIAGADAGLVLGTALTIKMVAYVGVAPIAAALVDRLPRKVVLVTADLVRLAAALTLPFIGEAWQIYVLVFVLQSASATFTPAFQALIPTVLPDPGQYTRALALSRLAYDLESLLSPVVAAALLGVMSYSTLFVGTAVGFAASAALVLIARLPEAEDKRSTTFWQRLPAGLQVFVRTPTLRLLMVVNVVVASGTALVLVNSVVYVKSVFRLDDAALAIALAAYGAGSLAVVFGIPRMVDRLGVTRTMLTGVVTVVAGLIGSVVMTGLLAPAAGWSALLLAWVVLGAGTSLINTPSSRLLAEASTPANRNLVYTAQFALSHACFLVTYPVAGVTGAVDLTGAVVVLAGLAVAAAAASFVLHRRTVDDGSRMES